MGIKFDLKGAIYIYSIPVWPLETLFHNFFYTCDKCASLYNLIEKWGSVQQKRKELKPLTGQQQVNTSLSPCVNMDMAKPDKDTTESQSRRLIWSGHVIAATYTGGFTCLPSLPQVYVSSPPPWHVLSCCLHHHSYSDSHWCQSSHTQIHTEMTRKQALAVPLMKSVTTHNVSALHTQSMYVWCCWDKVSW